VKKYDIAEMAIQEVIKFPPERVDFYMPDRLIDKSVRQLCLMRMRRTFIHKICLSSDIVSIIFTYFLSLAHPSLKYGIPFLLIQTAQHPLQALKKLIFISQLNPFEFFFDCRKQVEVTRD
jgi:hypothetical protein